MMVSITLPQSKLIAKNVLGMFQALQINDEGKITFDPYGLSVTNLI